MPVSGRDRGKSVSRSASSSVTKPSCSVMGNTQRHVSPRRSRSSMASDPPSGAPSVSRGALRPARRSTVCSLTPDAGSTPMPVKVSAIPSFTARHSGTSGTPPRPSYVGFTKGDEATGSDLGSEMASGLAVFHHDRPAHDHVGVSDPAAEGPAARQPVSTGADLDSARRCLESGRHLIEIRIQAACSRLVEARGEKPSPWADHGAPRRGRVGSGHPLDDLDLGTDVYLGTSPRPRHRYPEHPRPAKRVDGRIVQPAGPFSLVGVLA